MREASALADRVFVASRTSYYLDLLSLLSDMGANVEGLTGNRAPGTHRRVFAVLEVPPDVAEVGSPEVDVSMDDRGAS